MEQVRRELNQPELPIIIADSADPDSLSTMAKQTRTLISTVGPYTQYGTGAQSMRDEAHTIATSRVKRSGWRRCTNRSTRSPRTAGARLVHCCGFDSIPSDLSVFFLQKHFKERFGSCANHVTGRMGRAAGGVSGGTVASLMYVAEQASKDPIIKERVMDPYALTLPA